MIKRICPTLFANGRFSIPVCKIILPAIFIILLILESCATQKLHVPAIHDTDSNPHLYGKIVWRDLLTDNLPGVKKFYGDLFNWTFEGDSSATTPFTLARLNGIPVAGIFYSDLKESKVDNSQWLTFISTEEIDATVKKFEDDGGIIHREPWELGVRGQVAIVSDRDSALVCLIHSATGDPKDKESEMGGWLWTELIANDIRQSADFYNKTFGYDDAPVKLLNDVPYLVMSKDQKPRMAILQNVWKNVRPHFLPYIRVADVMGTVEKAKQLGGSIILEPSAEIREGTLALIADPGGAVFAIQKWPIE